MTVVNVTRENLGNVALLRLNRPEVRNAINDDLRSALVDHLVELDRDDEIRSVVLTGNGKAFAAGADLRALNEMDTVQALSGPAPTAYEAIRLFRKPIIAAVNGVALGGGCELAMLADIIIAGTNTKFGQPEIKVGIMPGAGGTQRLTRAIGKYKSMKMLLTGETITAEAADALGLVSEVVPDEMVLDRAVEIAATIAAMPPIAIRQIKKVVLEGADLPLPIALSLERQAFALLFASEDKAEGMRAFLEKRPPKFTGR